MVDRSAALAVDLEKRDAFKHKVGEPRFPGRCNLLVRDCKELFELRCAFRRENVPVLVNKLDQRGEGVPDTGTGGTAADVGPVVPCMDAECRSDRALPRSG